MKRVRSLGRGQMHASKRIIFLLGSIRYVPWIVSPSFISSSSLYLPLSPGQAGFMRALVHIHARLSSDGKGKQQLAWYSAFLGTINLVIEWSLSFTMVSGRSILQLLSQLSETSGSKKDIETQLRECSIQLNTYPSVKVYSISISVSRYPVLCSKYHGVVEFSILIGQKLNLRDKLKAFVKISIGLMEGVSSCSSRSQEKSSGCF